MLIWIWIWCYDLIEKILNIKKVFIMYYIMYSLICHMKNRKVIGAWKCSKTNDESNGFCEIHEIHGWWFVSFNEWNSIFLLSSSSSSYFLLLISAAFTLYFQLSYVEIFCLLILLVFFSFHIHSFLLMVSFLFGFFNFLNLKFFQHKKKKISVQILNWTVVSELNRTESKLKVNFTDGYAIGNFGKFIPKFFIQICLNLF